MSIYYLDASALVKRYVIETGSAWLCSVLASPQAQLSFTSRMTIVEITSAFARRAREGSLTPDDFATAVDAFRDDCLHDCQIMPPTAEIVDLACTLLARHPLRAYDATHLASALSAHGFLSSQGYPALVLLSADEHLIAAANFDRLAVDNPNTHP